jgi:cytochrome c
VVTGGDDGRVLVWDPSHPGVVPAATTGRDEEVQALAVLADARVVTGGDDGRLLAWNPGHPGAGFGELGRHQRWARTMAALTDGRAATAGADGRVLVWDLAGANHAAFQLNGSARVMAALCPGPGSSELDLRTKQVGCHFDRLCK